jgi:hypothetical protein
MCRSSSAAKTDTVPGSDRYRLSRIGENAAPMKILPIICAPQIIGFYSIAVKR